MAVKRDPDNLEKKYLHEQLNLSKKSVLEIGCGDGRLTTRYHKIVGKIIGIDVALETLKIARERGLPRTRFLSADALQLPFACCSFDSVIYAWSL